MSELVEAPLKINQQQKKRYDPTQKYAHRFTEDIFGLKPYKWQKLVLQDCSFPNSRTALRAANGSGKTAMCAAPLAVWHALLFEDSVCVTTSGVYRQVKEQMWPQIRKIASVAEAKLGVEINVNATDLTVPARNSRVIGFSTDDPGRFEGWHEKNLLMIVDEAKSVDDGIFEAIERCQPNRLLVMSSPGGNEGEFYRIFTKHADLYKSHVVTSYDCPHIKEDWIQLQFDKWGKDHPLVRSMIFGEFMQLARESTVLSVTAWEKALANPPRADGDLLTAGVDFAAGGDENVIALKRGNKLEKIISWVEQDTMAAIGRFIIEFQKAKLKPENIFCDEGGLGRPMADALKSAGWDVNRVQFGGKPYDAKVYTNKSAEMWFETARAIESGELGLIDDPILMQQLTSRRCRANKNGKLELETKAEMRARGAVSPDRADAVCLAVSASVSQEYISRIARPSIWETMEGLEFGQEQELEGAFCG